MGHTTYSSDPDQAQSRMREQGHTHPPRSHVHTGGPRVHSQLRGDVYAPRAHAGTRVHGCVQRYAQTHTYTLGTQTHNDNRPALITDLFHDQMR